VRPEIPPVGPEGDRLVQIEGDYCRPENRSGQGRCGRSMVGCILEDCLMVQGVESELQENSGGSRWMTCSGMVTVGSLVGLRHDLDFLPVCP